MSLCSNGLGFAQNPHQERVNSPPNSEKENQGTEIHADGRGRGKLDWFDVATDRLEKGLIESVQLLSKAVRGVCKNPIQDDGNEKT